jgi:3-dehydroquinate synthase
MAENVFDDKAIFYSKNCLDKFAAFIQNKIKAQRIFIVCDTNSSKHCLNYFRKCVGDKFAIHIIKIKAGEAQKNFETIGFICAQLNKYFAARSDVIVNLGGGVVCDAGGFAAAIYKRGMQFINIPTTLLAMIDAAIGGKTGVNFEGIKNNIGAFHFPEAIFVDLKFLQTLPPRHITNGFAEALKHALIYDKNLWQKIKNISPREFSANAKLIECCIKIKCEIVKADSNENGLRKLLNFGHTIGHAVESLSMLSPAPLLHGEAVMIGMLHEARLSHQNTGLPLNQLKEIENVLNPYIRNQKFKNTTTKELLPYLLNDKKNNHNHIRYTLLKEIGKGVVDVEGVFG